jgi:hypothetical protein
LDQKLNQHAGVVAAASITGPIATYGEIFADGGTID